MSQKPPLICFIGEDKNRGRPLIWLALIYYHYERGRFRWFKMLDSDNGNRILLNRGGFVMKSIRKLKNMTSLLLIMVMILQDSQMHPDI